ncbi:hypothetical protein CDAR_99811 [Caerostris darwini]|uniref:Uncharacterized protein n=1 Tax=Caerostris darwini TaxID=1538125 RepID=A0AAV4X245_9ARAC|nr:hypothetical protein CDAR_99811 [Caerostris darwini]
MEGKLDSESSRKVNRFEPIKHSMRMKRLQVISTSVYAVLLELDLELPKKKTRLLNKKRVSAKYLSPTNIGLDKEITTSPLGNNAIADNKQPHKVFLHHKLAQFDR